MLDRRNALDRGRPSDVDQSISDVGKREAKVAGLGSLVLDRLGFVIGPKELGERQGGGEKNRLKTRARGRCGHAVHPTLTKAGVKPKAIRTGSQPCSVAMAAPALPPGRLRGIGHALPESWLPGLLWDCCRHFAPTVFR
jgi:hypothetical protein